MLLITLLLSSLIWSSFFRFILRLCGSFAILRKLSGYSPSSCQPVLTTLGNSGLYWTVSTQNRDTAVPAEGNGDLQTLICVLVARPRRCFTFSNPVLWQNWMVVYLGYTLQMKTLFCGWPIMGYDTHTRSRRSCFCPFDNSFCQYKWWFLK